MEAGEGREEECSTLLSLLLELRNDNTSKTLIELSDIGQSHLGVGGSLLSEVLGIFSEFLGALF